MTTYKTPFSKRCEILADCHTSLRLSDRDSLHEYWQLLLDGGFSGGAKVASWIHWGYVTATDKGEKAINDSWAWMCNNLYLDPAEEYESINQMFALQQEAIAEMDYDDDYVDPDEDE